MLRSNDYMSSHNRHSWKSIIYAGTISLLGTFQMNVSAPIAIAQKPGDIAPSDIAVAATNRAETFLRAVAQFSPMPLGTDPDRAQAWPRADYREVRDPNETTTSKYERVQSTLVIAPSTSYGLTSGADWTVQFYGGEIDVTVNVTTGVIEDFFDRTLSGILGLDPAPDLPQCIPQDVAVSRAIQYLRATGINLDELALRSTRLVDLAVPASASTRYWDISFDRIWQGVPYRNGDGQVSLTLDAGYGRLMNFGASLNAQPPTIGRLDVSNIQAVDIARRFVTAQTVAAQAVALAGDSDVELRVVLPTDYWTTESIKPRTAQARLAWIVRTPVNTAQSGPRTFEVWIDTVTGDILGGENIGSRGKGKSTLPGGRIGQMLRTAQRIEAIPLPPTPQGKSKSATKSVCVLDGKADTLRFYGAVSGVVGPRLDKKPEPLHPTHRLIVTLEDGRKTTLLYGARTGQITGTEGKDKEIVQAGSAFRAWLNPLPLITVKR